MSKYRKGIIMAGGNGKRLSPLTIGVSKQLMPVYDKPMLYYPLSTLMLAGIRDILIIITQSHLDAFKSLLGDGSQWGISINFLVQKEPNGITEAFLIGENFIDNCPTALILGDNLFHSSDIVRMLKDANDKNEGYSSFTYTVKDPNNYAVVNKNEKGIPISILEKPTNFISNEAVTGLYFYDENVIDIAKSISPSNRGELEITSINQIYLKQNSLEIKKVQ